MRKGKGLLSKTQKINEKEKQKIKSFKEPFFEKEDKFGRTLDYVFVDGINLNIELVRNAIKNNDQVYGFFALPDFIKFLSDKHKIVVDS